LLGRTLADNDIMRIHVFWLVIAQLLIILPAQGDESYQTVIIADPYIELHTGPGSGYPIFHVIERGESITVLKRHTDWFQVRTQKGKEGWVNREQLTQTLAPTGEKVELKAVTQAEFEQRRWEVGAMGGEFGGAATLSIYGGYAFNKNLSAELTLSQALGNISSSLFLTGGLLAQPFPEWRYSPYFTLGTGVIKTKPRTTIVAPRDTTSQLSYVGIGVRTYLTRRFIFRIEYNDYVIFNANNDNDSNEELNQWKLGFAVFF
jgi:hypothetical protein